MFEGCLKGDWVFGGRLGVHAWVNGCFMHG